MFQYYLLFSIMLFSTLGVSQNQEFVSSKSDALLQIYERQVQHRTVKISRDKIVVTNYLEGGHKSLVAHIQTREKKEYLGLGLSDWFYCKPALITDNRTYTLIVPNKSNSDRLVLQEVINNVVTSSTDIYID